jgi:hypothetical protein
MSGTIHCQCGFSAALFVRISRRTPDITLSRSKLSSCSHEHKVTEKQQLSEDHNLVPIAEADETKVSAARGSSTKEGLQQEASDGLHFFFDWQCLSLTGDGVNRPSETSGEELTGQPYQQSSCKMSGRKFG